MAAITPDLVITAAATYLSNSLDLGPNGLPMPLNLTSIMKFTYGSGGTTLDVYLQTSFDGGATWEDIVHFTQITTASLKQIANTGRQAKFTPAAMTDGALAVTSANDGLLGQLLRVKAVSVGIYAGASTLHVDVFGEH